MAARRRGGLASSGVALLAARAAAAAREERMRKRTEMKNHGSAAGTIRMHSIVFALLVLCLRPSGLGAETQRPNSIVFLVDDVGYADIGVQEAEGFRTPNLDRMADEGMRLNDFYIHPVCGLTRAAPMTGCYAMRVGEVDNRKHPHPVLHPEEVTIAEVLKAAGYASGMIGKWHLAGEHKPGIWPHT